MPIGITKDGRWLTAGDAERLLQGKPHDESKHLRAGDPDATPGAAVLASGEAVVVPPEPVHRRWSLTPFQTRRNRPARRASDRAINVDVIFPVLHGTFGEDGTIQGLLELADIPYVGAGVLGSAAGMDKDIMKALFRAAGLPIVKHVTILRSDWDADPRKPRSVVERELKYPVFVKPANLDPRSESRKARTKKELGPAIYEAAKFDRKIVIEQGVGGAKHKAREIECSVLGNDRPAGFRAGRDRPRQGVLRLLGQVSRRRLGADHSGEAHESRNEESAGTRHPRLSGGRLLRPRAASTSSWTRKRASST